ncbi:MFS transporter [Dehalobacter sp. DCM]|uniref:MFS transporter n=1 Tax=Dehalobacter sp. DCM TaxID=2907827 RepID=UPI0030820A72|nr:MFS transporter [Dehalobacter sp. DCM]
MSHPIQGVPIYFDGSKIGSIQRKFLWLAAICYVFDQMDLVTFTNVAPVLMKSWHLTMSQIAQVNSANLWGMFFGAIFGGWLADKIGRKKGLLISVATFSLASIFNSFATNLPHLIVSRFVTGFGVVGTVVIAMVYIAEMLPSENRGRYQALTIACGTIGAPLGTMFAKWVIPLGPETWRFVFILGGGTIIFVFLGLFWFKESPRWLVSKGRITEAERLVEQITGKKVDLSEGANRKEQRSSTLEAIKVMLSKSYIKRTLLLLLMAISITLGGFLLGSFYPAMLQENVGLSITSVLLIMTIANWGVPLGDLTASFFSDKGGRKIPICVFSFISAGLFLIIGYFPIASIVGFLMLLRSAFGGGSMSMLYTYLAESYPTHVRSNSVGIVFGVARIVSANAVLIVPPVLAAYGWRGAHWLAALVLIIPAISVLIFGEKTSQRTLEDINDVN